MESISGLGCLWIFSYMEFMVGNPEKTDALAYMLSIIEQSVAFS
jgi:hypothetical protein